VTNKIALRPVRAKKTTEKAAVTFIADKIIEIPCKGFLRPTILSSPVSCPCPTYESHLI
jgi:hypothetical protein